MECKHRIRFYIRKKSGVGSAGFPYLKILPSIFKIEKSHVILANQPLIDILSISDEILVKDINGYPKNRKDCFQLFV